MKKTAALAAAFALAFLSGCVNSMPQKTSAQAASAIAKNKPYLISATEYFGMCGVVLEMTKTGEAADDCNKRIDNLGAAAGRMKADLEAAGPWPEEVREIAEKTTKAFGDMVEAASSDDPDRAARIMVATEQTAKELVAWKPFGA